MPNVKKSTILQKKKGTAITEWFVDIEGLPIHWKQEDFFDYANFTLHFRAFEGDLAQFEGKWILKPGKGSSTDVVIEVKARLGIPIFENVVDDILEIRLRKNFEMMLMSMEEMLIRHRYHPAGGKPKSPVRGFIVMGHPYNFQHLVRIFKVFKPDVTAITPEFLMKIFELAPSYRSSDIKDFRSETGETIDGYFVMCPIIPDMVQLSPDIVFAKVLEGCRIGERLGAGILALGGFTSIVGEKYFDELKSRVKMPVTTGNTFTAAMALAGVRKACQLMEIPLKTARATIIGGTGDIGSACAKVLVREVKELTISGRTPKSVKEWEERLKKQKGAKVSAMMDNNQAIRKADIVIAAASSTQSLINMAMIKPGAVVCDVAYPKNIAYNAVGRDDIFVFSGGLSTVPTPFNLGFDIGLPSPNILYGCFAEAILLSLEGRYENFSEGKGYITPTSIQLIQRIGEKHGFRLAPFFWGDKPIDEKTVGLIQARAKVA